MWYSLSFLVIAASGLANGGVYLNVSGDITLGALFPIHRKGSNGQSCGKIQVDDGIQPLEAMLYTIRQINQDPTILPGIRLGVLAFDSCDHPNYALEQALNFVKGFIAHVNEFHEQEFQCLDGSVPKFLGGGFDKVVAVLAAQSSSVTLQVASMLRLFGVPQISYMATTPSLSSKERFPHFFRTVPSDVNQAHAMLEILKRFEWTYVSVVYSDTEYGNHGYETLVSLANNYSICFSAPQRIDKERFEPEDYDNVIRTIANKTEVRVVVLFAEKTTTLRVLEAAKRLGVGTRFVWIGSDAWSTSNHREFLNPGNHNKDHELVVLEGALAVQPLSRRMSGFDEYFTGLTLKHETTNPWFNEFWREYHRCGRRNFTSRARRSENDESFDFTEKHDDSCHDPGLKINEKSGYKQQKFLHFVRDAVYSVAYALHDLQLDKCGKNFHGMCDELRHIDGSTLCKYLKNVTFKVEGSTITEKIRKVIYYHRSINKGVTHALKGMWHRLNEAGNPFRFVNGVDGPPRYSILNYQRDDSNTYHWQVVGNYTQSDKGKAILHVDPKIMKYRSSAELGRRFFPNSSCALPCQPNQVKVREKQDVCCWRCRNCGLYQYKVDDHRCEDCEWGTEPTSDRKLCAPIPEEFIDYSSPWAVAAMAVASCGILLTIFVLSVFWIYSETPVIKASGRELSSLLLLGTLVSFLMTFAVVAEPSTETCAITRFGIGICYTLCYAALVTKTNRIHRIFNTTTQCPHKPRYTSPKSQLIITGILTFFEVLINGAWLLKVPPSIAHSYPTRDSRLRICRGLDDRSYMVGLIYPFILIVACTIYAVKTRKCPEGFKETRHIAFTNYTTMILWLAFVPLYLASTSNAIRVVTLGLSLSISGLVQLGCLFFPKVYIVLIKPEKNTKELVMAQHRSSSYLPTPATPVVVLNGLVIRSNTVGSESSFKSSVRDGSTSNLYRLKPLTIDSDLGSNELTTDNTSDTEVK